MILDFLVQVCVDAPTRQDHLQRDRRDDNHGGQEWGLEDLLFRVQGEFSVVLASAYKLNVIQTLVLKALRKQIQRTTW